jgi:glycosyltransferase involved in cell wall biosynthesis
MIVWDSLSARGKGGTEIMMQALEQRLSPELHSKFAIGRAPALLRTKFRHKKILWVHNTPGLMRDKEFQEFLSFTSQDRWLFFQNVVFVSEWQKSQYKAVYGLNSQDEERLHVIHNAISPVEEHKKPHNVPIRIIYTTVPERGLQILLDAFEKLQEWEPNVELYVYGSSLMHGWGKLQTIDEKIFKLASKVPKTTVMGAVDQPALYEAYKQAHIYVNPGALELETACLGLMEAMSAKLVCITSTAAALPETGKDFTLKYVYDKTNPALQVHLLLEQLKLAVDQVKQNKDLTEQKLYVDQYHSWQRFELEWTSYLNSLV